ncbi:hypothetical protein [Pleionea sediminis]|uniref:hypothetical protein n=1 Tax=Pleionea sediminis TaxID=2569479 RepID=UPI001184A1D4|nr:hypothetical protein [Pleionea sediminis]
MEAAKKETFNTPESYLIYNDTDGWFLKLNGDSILGPFESYFDVEKRAKVFCVLSNELKDVV